VSVNSEGKPAHTVFRLVARWQGCSLLEAQLRTGRTHQIRVHLAHLGFPILGDEKYGDFELNRHLRRDGLKRMGLHAWRMSFRHPLTGAPLQIEAPVPPALAAWIVAVDRRERREFGEELLEQLMSTTV
jgi:23S rRNA pseudouridine955/2504/2580 synthase